MGLSQELQEPSGQAEVRSTTTSPAAAAPPASSLRLSASWSCAGGGFHGCEAVTWRSERFYLGEEPPPLPVTELQVRSTVPLKNLEAAQLLLLLSEGSEGQTKDR